MNRNIRCQSCDQPKAVLDSVPSKLFPTMSVVICKTCISGGFEPRYLVVISIEQNGMTAEARNIIDNRKYVGKPIEPS